jgi:hypothetical protein
MWRTSPTDPDHYYGPGDGTPHLHYAGDAGAGPAAQQGGQRWRAKPDWATRFTSALGVIIQVLCCTGWYMLARMNQLNYGAITAAGAIIAGAVIVTDLFSLVAGAREGGIKLSSPADLAVVAGRVAELLRLGVRLLRVSTGVGAEATMRALEASQVGAPPGAAAHYDVRVPYHGGSVRVRLAVRCSTQAQAERVGQEVEALYLNGPAAGGGVTQSVREVIAAASALVPRDAAQQAVTLMEL